MMSTTLKTGWFFLSLSVMSFSEALQMSDIKMLRLIPKSDLHNHALLGFDIAGLRQWKQPQPHIPPEFFSSFADFEAYVETLISGSYFTAAGIAFGIRSAFEQARTDGVSLLQMSIDSRLLHLFDDDAGKLVSLIEHIYSNYSEDIRFIPQLGLARNHHLRLLMKEAEALLDTAYFKSIDLYGDELYASAENFIPLYRKAEQLNMTLTAHAGEYGSADDVRTTAEILHLSQVQHGINAVQSPEIMQWLSHNNIMLNVCLSSNVALNRAASIASHPARILFDHGIKISLNTDDIMIFGNTINDEYLKAFQEHLFTEKELDIIRLQGLNSFSI